MYKLKIGMNLYKARKDAGLTQEEVARMVGCSKQTISSWEKDRTQPHEEQLNKLAEIYSTDPKVLLYSVENIEEQLLVAIDDGFAGTESMLVKKSYENAPEYIKDVICKFLDIDRTKVKEGN